MKQEKTIHQILRSKYPEGEYVLVKEVADSTRRNRYLDYMVINLWESRGLSITGIEVKSYRSDWVKELKNPKKQELHAPYCDYFYLLTSDDKVAKMEEIPENWGWMTIKGDKIFTLKKAPKQNALPIPKHLMISIIRRADDKSDFVHKDSIKSTVDELAEQKIKSKLIEYDAKIANYEILKKIVEDFENASGIELRRGWRYNPSEIGKTVRYLASQDFKDLSGRLKSLKDITISFDKKIDDVLQELNQVTAGIDLNKNNLLPDKAIFERLIRTEIHKSLLAKEDGSIVGQDLLIHDLIIMLYGDK